MTTYQERKSKYIAEVYFNYPTKENLAAFLWLNFIFNGDPLAELMKLRGYTETE